MHVPSRSSRGHSDPLPCTSIGAVVLPTLLRPETIRHEIPFGLVLPLHSSLNMFQSISRASARIPRRVVLTNATISFGQASPCFERWIVQVAWYANTLGVESVADNIGLAIALR